MVQRYLRPDLVFRGYPGKRSWISRRINNLSMELVFRGNQGKCRRIHCRIYDLSHELVFRGPEQYSAHGSDKIRPFVPEFILRDVPGEV